jgi:copper(I)-binding protein
VGHGCDGAPTTSIDVLVPAGVTRVRALPKPDWQLLQTGNEIVWTAARGKALDAKEKGEFGIEFEAPRQTGAVWFKVLQRCQGSSMNWADVPAQGTSTEGMKTPALLLQVVSAQEAAAIAAQPAVEGAWVRSSVPGQQATGAFMRITAKAPTQLVGASSPVAGTAAVHEMKMEGDVMRMRPVGAIDLPVGRAFELKPGSYHLMLQDLKKTLEPGSTVPVTLVFRDAKGVESRMDLRLPVAVQAPGATGETGGMMMDHKH